jgi:hypothetical protein
MRNVVAESAKNRLERQTYSRQEIVVSIKDVVKIMVKMVKI